MCGSVTVLHGLSYNCWAGSVFHCSLCGSAIACAIHCCGPSLTHAAVRLALFLPLVGCFLATADSAALFAGRLHSQHTHLTSSSRLLCKPAGGKVGRHTTGAHSSKTQTVASWSGQLHSRVAADMGKALPDQQPAESCTPPKMLGGGVCAIDSTMGQILPHAMGLSEAAWWWCILASKMLCNGMVSSPTKSSDLDM